MSIQTKRRRTQAERTQASDKAIYKAAIKLIARDGPQNMSLAKLGALAADLLVIVLEVKVICSRLLLTVFLNSGKGVY